MSVVRVLVVDDEAQVRAVLARGLTDAGYEAHCAPGGDEALALAAGHPPDVAVVDWRMPGLDGIETCRRLGARHPGMIRLLMTGYPFEAREVDRLLGAGIRGFLVKPVRLVDVVRRVRDARAGGHVAPEIGALAEGPVADDSQTPGFERMVGTSAPMRRVFETIRRVAPLDASVLVQGETGTGKELVARALHRRSRHPDGPFVGVNCAAVPVSIFESTLFGHERGAFTGAHERHTGCFEQARGGTLFLDEIGELPHDAQAKLLRALDTNEVTRVGGRGPIALDARVVAATNVDLRHAVERGTFRNDLYFRLNALCIRLPPLRDRAEDLPRLLDYYWTRLATQLGRPEVRLAPEARAALLGHDWPGNVRELEHTLRQALVNADGGLVRPEDLTLDADGAPTPLTPADLPLPPGVSLAQALAAPRARLERACIAAALAAHAGHHGRAADALRINRRTLHDKMRRYDLVPVKPSSPDVAERPGEMTRTSNLRSSH